MGALKLLLATENPHKLIEFSRILEGTAKVLSLKDIGFDEKMPPEGADSFRENSRQKAEFVAEKTGQLTIADDSGFEVEALGNQPGVLSARYANTKDESIQRQTILKNTAGEPDRRARFVCELSICDPKNHTTKSFRGIVEGQLSQEERGTNGFGYDPIFIPDGYDKTFGEMAAEQKNELSHRKQAILKLKEYLEENPIEI